MADLTISIKEQIILDGTERGTEFRHVIPNITAIDNRILTAKSGSETEIFSFGSVNGAGTFVTSSFKYGRITNHSTTSIDLHVSSVSESVHYNIAKNGSFTLSTTNMTGSIVSSSFEYSDIESIKIEPSGSDAKVEYYIATL